MEVTIVTAKTTNVVRNRVCRKTTRTIIKIGICVVEDTYEMPIDVEWAFVDGDDGGDDSTGKDDNNNDQQ